MELFHLAISGLIVFGAIGIVSGILLAVAAVRFRVEVNPKIVEVQHNLPMANCGGCSYPGCEAYAEAVVTDPSVPPDLCRPGGRAVSEVVARLTGKAMGADEPVVSFRRCVKDEGKVQTKYDYVGVPSCAAATLALSGPDACPYSCLGFGDCARACPFGAMRVEGGLVRIDKDKCTGCGVCIRICPKQVLELVPGNARVMIFCSTKDKGKAVTSVCEAGCIACMKCVKACPAEAVSMVDNRIVVDHKKCVAYGPDCKEACVDSCPRAILRRMGQVATVEQQDAA